MKRKYQTKRTPAEQYTHNVTLIKYGSYFFVAVMIALSILSNIAIWLKIMAVAGCIILFVLAQLFLRSYIRENTKSENNTEE